ncbi:MAG: hypothetical protein AB1422_00280 [bacterium]
MVPGMEDDTRRSSHLLFSSFFYDLSITFRGISVSKITIGNVHFYDFVLIEQIFDTNFWI